MSRYVWSEEDIEFEEQEESTTKAIEATDYIQDGHHRLTALRLLGYKQTTARVVSMPKVLK